MSTPNENLLSQDFLQNLFLQAPAAIAVVVGKDLRYVQANVLYQQLFNRTKEELLGHTIRDAFPELEGEGTLEMFDNVYASGEAFKGNEYLFTWDRKRDGTLEQGYFNFIAQPVKNNNDEVYAILIHVFEVTEQVEDRKKIEESAREFRQIADSMPQIVWTCRPDGFIDYYNKKWYEYTGFEEGFGDQSWIPILHPDDVDHCLKIFYEAISSGQKYQIEYRFIDRNNPGKYRWFMGLANPVKDVEGNIVKWFGSCTDINDQKEAAELLEKKVAARTATLAEMAKSFEHAEQISKMGNFKWNLDTNTVVWSRNLYNIFGVVPGLFTPSIDAIVPFTHPEDLEDVIAQTALAIEDSKAYSITYRIIDATGNEKYISGSGTMDTDAQGNNIMTGTLQDVTLVKLQELVLNKKNAELEAANNELESFAYISSHDLQEPLRKIQTLTSHLKETEAANLSERGIYIFGRVQKAAYRMQALINDLLAYSRTSTEERRFNVLDLESIVEEAKSDLSEELQSGNATIIVAKSCDIYVIHYQFRQLLDNLISNSLKFVRPGVAPEICITGRLEENNESGSDETKRLFTHIKFEDNGIGIEAQYSEKVFKVFQRLHERDAYPGTGIGLAIVKKIVDYHGGEVSISQSKSGGACFDISIPFPDC